MHIFTGIYRLVIALIAFAVVAYGLNDHYGGADAEIADLESLAANGTTTIATLDGTYREASFATSTTYFFDYAFVVDGKEYTGFFSKGDPDEVTYLQTEVTYLPSDPSVNKVDPMAMAAKKQQNKEGKGGVVVSVLAFLFGSAMLWRSVVAFRSGGEAASKTA